MVRSPQTKSKRLQKIPAGEDLWESSEEEEDEYNYSPLPGLGVRDVDEEVGLGELTDEHRRRGRGGRGRRR